MTLVVTPDEGRFFGGGRGMGAGGLGAGGLGDIAGGLLLVVAGPGEGAVVRGFGCEEDIWILEKLFWVERRAAGGLVPAVHDRTRITARNAK